MILKFLIKKILSVYIMIKGHQTFILKYIFFNNKKYENKSLDSNNVKKNNDLIIKENNYYLDEIVFFDFLYF